MSVTLSSPVETSAAALPYIGLRPFEAHERDRFFGRERDADLLCTKILGGRLTILYAQSGLGKSSLLRAAVIPRLEANASRVVYFDAWAQDDPLALLKEALVRTAEALGVPHAGRGSPTLTELARLICSADGRGLILVLDQFEEFLVHHVHALDPVRHELAGLLRASNLDATVVLSLREEFLASLEPLRHQILNLFTCTYRLEHLAPEDLRQAIEQPARLFAGECEPQLVDRLMADLSGPRSCAASGGVRPAVELPMLQLVCQELWAHAEQGRLTLALYERLGGAHRILNDYVRALMPKGWRDRCFTAQLLLYLAPPSGLKMSYSAQDLALITGLGAAEVEKELDRLSEARILRTRNYRMTSRYELQHDAFITVLQAWRNQVVERQRRLAWTRRLLATSAVVALIGAVAAGFVYYRKQQQVLMATELAKESVKRQEQRTRYEVEKEQQQHNFTVAKQLMDARVLLKETEARQAQIAKEQEEKLRLASEESRQKLENWQTGGILDDLQNMAPDDRKSLAPGRFEVVTYYVLWHKDGPQRFKQLKEALQRSAALLPEDYGMLAMAKSSSSANMAWPITIAHAESRAVDQNGFNQMWRETRDYVTETWGIPLPTEVRLVVGPTLRRDEIQIQGDEDGADPDTLPVPAYDGLYMIRSTEARLPKSPARDFLQYYASDWQRFSPEANVDYRLVPAWSLPVWKLAGEKPVNGGAIVAYLTMLHLLKEPKLIFSARAVDALLAHTAKTFPNTVAEARAASGDRLPAELTDRVRADRTALAALPQILDVLGERAPTTTIAAKSGAGVTTLARTRQLNGPWPNAGAVGPKPAAATDDEEDARKRVSSDRQFGLAYFPPIHVYVASNLIPGWFPGSELSKELSDAVAALRTDIYLSYGVTAPGFRFAPESGEPYLQPNTIRIAVHAATPLYAVNTIRRISGPNTVDSLIRELRSTLVNTRTLWVTAETTNAVVKDMPPRTREWLQKHYSLTDLKRLLRTSLSAVNGPAGAPSSNVRFASWALTSLPFWSAIDDPLDERVIGRDLAGLSTVPADVAGIPEPICVALERGADALVADDPGAAVAEFERAVKLDRAAAVDGFRAVWARRLPQVFTQELTRRYASLDRVHTDTTERIDLEDMSRIARGIGDRDALWQLGVYRLAADTDAKDADARKQADNVRALLREAGEFERNPAQARWLSLRFLEQYNPLTADPADTRALNDASALFKRGVRHLNEPASLDAFAKLAGLAQINGNWAWPLVDDVVNMARQQGAESIVLELAWRLAAHERRDRLERSLALADEFEKMTSARPVSDAKRAEWSGQILYVHATARLGLERLGVVQVKDVEPLLRELQQSTRDDLQKEAASGLAQLLIDHERYAEGNAVVAKALEKWPSFPDPVGAQLKGYLRRGDTAGVVAIARLAAKKYQETKDDDDRTGWLYLETLASIIAREPHWESVVERFLTTTHGYRDYITMIALAYGRSASPRFVESLKGRLTELDPSMWPDRLRNGDPSAWREMLLGRFKDMPESAAILTTVTNDAAFDKSDFAQLPMAQIGEQCEAWFYDAMAAKARGDKARMLESLRRSVATGFTAYYEYAMASYLLAHPD